MKILSKWLLISGLAVASFTSASADTVIHLKDSGFATPEAMEYESQSDSYLVANINGSPFAKDGNGFISKVSPEGEIIDLKWIDGQKKGISLNAPKGMLARDGKLYVADIDRVRVFSLADKKQHKDIIFPGSSFINGLSAAPDGGIYVTDSGMAPGFKPSGTDALYHVSPAGKVSKLKQGSLGNPNGVFAERENLWMVTLGSGQLRYMDLQGNEKARMTLPFNRLDGLLTTNDGRLLTSSWKAEGVFEITSDYKIKPVVTGLTSPADLGYDSKRNRILIPIFLKDEVIVYALD